MKVYFWFDPAGVGWDIVAFGNSEAEARKYAIAKAREEVAPEDVQGIVSALSGRPLGIFHSPGAICIFTEHDPVKSRISRDGIAKLENRIKELEEELKKVTPGWTERSWQTGMV